MECFCNELICNDLTGNTINRFFNEFRVKILENSIKEHSKEFDIFELDESYFGARRVWKKRTRSS